MFQVHYKYAISFSIKPCGGMVLPAFVLSLDAIIPGISSCDILPIPTYSNVPAIIRTMLYKNALPVMVSVIILPGCSSTTQL